MSANPVPRPEHPPRHSIADLVAVLGVQPDSALGAGGGPITGVSQDSAAVYRGDLYVALPGAKTHGARYVVDAIQRGAAVILTDPAGAGSAREAAQPASVPLLVIDDPRARLGEVAAWVYGDPSAGLTVLGVTGTNGKTTTVHLIEAGLRAAGHITGLIGTIETRVAGVAVPSVRTTPEATDLQALYAVMRERGVTAVAMEVSSHALSLHRVDGTTFAAGLFTNLSQDHLDFHGDMESYFAAKAMLFDGRCGVDVVNVDDVYGRRLVRPSTVTVSAAGRSDAHWRATDVHTAGTGSSTFTVRGPGQVTATASVRAPGRFNQANALLAIAGLSAVEVPLADALHGVATLDVPGRMEQVDRGQSFLAVVDYAHTPEAVAAVLAELRPRTAGRIIVVLGCGGDRDRDKRPLMGAAAAGGADLVVVTDDNPRSEEPARIRAAVVEGVRRAGQGRWLEIGDRRAAIEAAIAQAEPGDCVLVAGKGHEQGQEVAGNVHRFDDRQVLTELLDAVAG
ncbi:MAG: UDP-N-acetylmuramoyl-L-alanyl-D-glutamate--2,6-diaminopimelate ligase [Actinomycetota bacterium]|nr:UDP-N-acetylmuramoyl-L-alanyl-D-glutamate--2,6-diaminopimelate ligase [Actinomycetota bacterium]